MPNYKISGLTAYPNSTFAATDKFEVSYLTGGIHYSRYLTGTQIFNTLQATLVSGTNIKTINGNSLLGSGDLVISGGGGSGIFGIPNASGVYTYYATLTLAMAAAVSGNTIEMFADVTETGAVTVNLKSGVNINGNSHTYLLTNSGTSNCIQDNGVSLICEIFNIKFKRTSATASSTAALPLYITSATTQIINHGVSYESTFGLAAAISGKVTGGYFRGELSGNLSLTVLSTGILTNANFYSAVGYAKIDGTAINCTFRSDGSYAVSALPASSRLIHCTGYSTSNYGIYVGSGYILNCVGYSTANSAIYTANADCIVENCTGYSTGVCGIQGFGDFINSVGESTANAGIFGTSIINCTAKSSAAKATWLSGKMYNSVSICSWNNASGHAVELQANNTEILECVLQTTNATANSIYSGTAYTCKYAINAFKGATTAVNANVTQGITNISDTKGNILI